MLRGEGGVRTALAGVMTRGNKEFWPVEATVDRGPLQVCREASPRTALGFSTGLAISISRRARPLYANAGLRVKGKRWTESGEPGTHALAWVAESRAGKDEH